jgi:hypothetical protein
MAAKLVLAVALVAVAGAFVRTPRPLNLVTLAELGLLFLLALVTVGQSR